MRKVFRYLWLSPLVLVLGIGAYFLPPIHDRLSWRLDDLRTNVKYFFSPPDQAVFQPTQQAQMSILVTQAIQTLSATLTPQATSTPTPGPTPTPTVTSTPLPASVDLKGFVYEDQHGRWNYCGPTNFAMALSYWGWKGNRDDVGRVVMPGNTSSSGKPINADKNVMPYEFQDYITQYVPGLTSVLRYGGDIDMVKHLLASGFPVVAEKGYYEQDYTGKVSWMGHYQFITGYDDATGELIVQDTYNDGPNFHIPYQQFMDGWRSFDFLFVVVYPPDRENQVMSLLGPLADANSAARHALMVAQQEGQSLTGINRFFAWFNVGTSYVALNDYTSAASAYDMAFNLYANLTDDDTMRPFRIMWYETGPYFAYYYTNRYTDVINLANTTLNDTIGAPVLEESLLWRGRAYYMTGQTQLAINDYRAALKVHPKWAVALQALQELGFSS